MLPVVKPLAMEQANTGRKLIKPRHVYSGILSNASLQSCIQLPYNMECAPHSNQSTPGYNTLNATSSGTTVTATQPAFVNIDFLKGKILCIEGNIKSGKNTLIAYLEKHLRSISGSQTNTTITHIPISDELMSVRDDIFRGCNNMHSNDAGPFNEFLYLMTESITRMSVSRRFLSNDCIYIMRQTPFSILVLAKLAHVTGNITTNQFNIIQQIYDKSTDPDKKVRSPGFNSAYY